MIFEHPLVVLSCCLSVFAHQTCNNFCRQPPRINRGLTNPVSSASSPPNELSAGKKSSDTGGPLSFLSSPFNGFQINTNIIQFCKKCIYNDNNGKSFLFANNVIQFSFTERYKKHIFDWTLRSDETSFALNLKYRTISASPVRGVRPRRFTELIRRGRLISLLIGCR